MGVHVAAPFMTLSFLALSVIPSLKITDRGLIDVERLRDRPARGLRPAASDSYKARGRIAARFAV